MALIKCKECGSEVSTTAKACPKCGAPPPQDAVAIFGKMIAEMGFGTILIVTIFLVWVWTTIFPKAEPEKSEAKPTTSQAQPLVAAPPKQFSEGSCSAEQRSVAKTLILVSGRKCDAVSFCSGSYPNVRVTCNQDLFAYRIVDRGEGTVVELD